MAMKAAHWSSTQLGLVACIYESQFTKTTSLASTIISFSFPSGVYVLLKVCLSVSVLLLYLDVISNMSNT